MKIVSFKDGFQSIKVKLSVFLLVVALVFLMYQSLTPGESVADLFHDAGVEDHVVNIGGLRIYYQTLGNPSGQVLVSLHGWGGSYQGSMKRRIRFWKELADRGFYVVAPEHPGLLRSDPPASVWTTSEYAEYVESLTNKLGIESFVLHGQSFGGLIATSYAVQYSQKIKGLVLTDAAVTSNDMPVTYRIGFNVSGRLLSWSLQSPLIPNLIKKQIALIALRAPTDFLNETTYEKRAIMGKVLSGGRQGDIDETKIAAPTLIIWGKYDVLVPLSVGKKLHRQIANSNLLILPGGHAVYATKTEKVIEFIADEFIKL